MEIIRRMMAKMENSSPPRGKKAMKAVPPRKGNNDTSTKDPQAAHPTPNIPDKNPPLENSHPDPFTFPLLR